MPLTQQIGKKVRKCHSGKRSVTGIGELYYKMYVFFRLHALERIPGKPEWRILFAVTKSNYTLPELTE